MTSNMWTQDRKKKRSLFSLEKTCSVSYFPQTFYLLGGWALRLGLILSCRLEPVPLGQLSANTQQPLSTYSGHSYTKMLHYTHMFKHTAQNFLYLNCFQQLQSNRSNTAFLKTYIRGKFSNIKCKERGTVWVINFNFYSFFQDFKLTRLCVSNWRKSVSITDVLDVTVTISFTTSHLLWLVHGQSTKKSFFFFANMNIHLNILHK